jgi:predicted SprT family Zn-dependent metalloprotease
MRRMKSSGIEALAEDLRLRGDLPPSKRELLKELRKRGELPPAPKQLLKKLAAQNEPPSSTVRPKKADAPITVAEYTGLQEAFDFLNTKLFDGTLPNVVILLQRRAHSGGHFAPDRFTSRAGSGGYHEISLNPNGFTGQTDKFIISILLHEMDHLWQQVFGKKQRKSYSYHDKEWAAKMKSQGLMPSNTGMVGGKETGQRMSHYILPGGAYEQAFAELAAGGWKLNLESTIYPGGEKNPKKDKTKYTCSSCGLNMWANIPDADISCNSCRCVMPAERPASQSYDQAAE